MKGADPNFNGDGRSDILRPDCTENVAICEMNGVSILNQATSPVAKCLLTGRSTTRSGRATSCGTTQGQCCNWEMNGLLARIYPEILLPWAIFGC